MNRVLKHVLLGGIFAYNALHLLERLLDVVERYYVGKLQEAGRAQPLKDINKVI
jgi:hypothetical protein